MVDTCFVEEEGERDREYVVMMRMDGRRYVQIVSCGAVINLKDSCFVCPWRRTRLRIISKA